MESVPYFFLYLLQVCLERRKQEKGIDTMNEQILERLKRIEDLIAQQDTVLSFNEACKYINLSSSQLYKLTSKAEIPHSKPNGKKIYFSKRELDSWLMRKRVKTTEEIEQEAINHVGSKKTK